jgi:HAMP domain-containing protein
MIWIIAVVKVLTILAIYGGLVWALERRSASRLNPMDATRHADATSKARARRHGKVA